VSLSRDVAHLLTCRGESGEICGMLFVGPPAGQWLRRRGTGFYDKPACGALDLAEWLQIKVLSGRDLGSLIILVSGWRL